MQKLFTNNNVEDQMDKSALIQVIAHPGVAAKLSSMAMSAGGASAVYGWWTVNEWCAIIGASAAVIFGLITVVLRYKTYLILKQGQSKSNTSNNVKTKLSPKSVRVVSGATRGQKNKQRGGRNGRNSD